MDINLTIFRLVVVIGLAILILRVLSIAHIWRSSHNQKIDKVHDL